MTNQVASKKDILILDEYGTYRKLFKIVPYKSGGFALILPKLINTQVGRLEKTSIDYKNYGTHLDIKRDESEQYNASDIVKFSYHPDGFVQFSSATNSRIISGRNSNGTPKGLGIISHPLNNPVSTGASMTITFWGLDKFEKESSDRFDSNCVFDTRKSTLHPKAHFNADDDKSFAMAIYIIPNSIDGRIFEKDGCKYAYLTMMQGLPNGKAFVRLRELVRIIEMIPQNFRIAISWFFIPKKASSDSGYIFFGPTDGKRGLAASYPAIDYGEKLKMKDLGFIKEK